MPVACSGCGEPNDREGQRHCAKCHRIYMAEWRGQKTAERSPIIEAVKRDRRIKNKYNLSPEEFEATLRIQGHACAICVTRFGEGRMDGPRVDHDHATGQVRGLLCHKCNVAIGLLDDQPRFFDLAAHYLRTRSSVKREVIPKAKKTMADILRASQERGARP